MRRHLAIYVATLSVFGAGILFFLASGAEKFGAPSLSDPVPQAAASPAPAGSPLGVLLAQIIVILVAARIVGVVVLRLRQPRVIGEILVGILLGPSLLGAALPGALVWLFPPSSMTGLSLFAQLGVVLFMFLVGMELDLRHLKARASSAVLVSHASIVVPFFLGVAVSYWLYPELAPESVSFVPFALFMGIAMSVTAFPVLARILEERRLSGSPLGTTAIACAAVDDVTAWCLLALVIAITGAAGAQAAALTVGAVVLFVAAMFFGVGPLLPRLLGEGRPDGDRSLRVMGAVLAFVLASAWLTEEIGIHALFGAFFAGVILPDDANLRRFLRERLETFSTTLLLPLFFAFTGLRTQIGMLGDAWSWLVCGAIVLTAVAGKLGGSAVAARLSGLGWRESLSLGALMNTRGLVELVVLNVGYDLGILSPRAFAMMVLMALVTTVMTGPLLSLLGPDRARA